MEKEAERAWPHSHSVTKPGSPPPQFGDTFNSNHTEQFLPLAVCTLPGPHPCHPLLTPLSDGVCPSPKVTHKDLPVLSLLCTAAFHTVHASLLRTPQAVGHHDTTLPRYLPVSQVFRLRSLCWLLLIPPSFQCDVPPAWFSLSTLPVSSCTC